MTAEELKLYEDMKGSCFELLDLVNDLKAENAFLADTIEKSNLGEIAAERRQLLAEVREADKIKDEYNEKNIYLESVIEENETKRSAVNAYIDREAGKKAADIKEQYQKMEEKLKADNEKELERLKEEAKELSRRKISGYRIALLAAIACFIVEAVFHLI